MPRKAAGGEYVSAGVALLNHPWRRPVKMGGRENDLVGTRRKSAVPISAVSGRRRRLRVRATRYRSPRLGCGREFRRIGRRPSGDGDLGAIEPLQLVIERAKADAEEFCGSGLVPADTL